MKSSAPASAYTRASWPNIDEGWTRWLLEQFGFAYTSLRNADIQAGNLRNRFDSIVFADEQPNAIENGHPPGTMPPEFTGGLGAKGADALREFAARRRHVDFSEPRVRIMPSQQLGRQGAGTWWTVFRRRNFIRPARC